jgi:hypothetical protein
MRREELYGLRVRDMQSRQDVVHFWVRGTRGKIRFVPVHPMAQRLIEEYLTVAGRGADAGGLLFRPVTNNRTGELDRALDPASVYRNIVRKYGLETIDASELIGLCDRAVGLMGYSARVSALATLRLFSARQTLLASGFTKSVASGTRCPAIMRTRPLKMPKLSGRIRGAM